MKTRPIAVRRCNKNRGVAAVEFAVCVPVILLLFFGTLECADMLFLKQTLSVSAYEGARRAIQFDATSDEALARSNDILTFRQIDTASVNLNPSDVSNVLPGTPIEVTVSAPCSSNSVLPLRFFDGRSLAVTTTMIKE